VASNDDMERIKRMRPGAKIMYSNMLRRGTMRNTRLYINVLEESLSCKEDISWSCSCSSITSGDESLSESVGYLKVRRRRAPDILT
jgi:hypothetical protein